MKNWHVINHARACREGAWASEGPTTRRKRKEEENVTTSPETNDSIEASEKVEAAASKWAARASKTPHVADGEGAVKRTKDKRIEFGKIPNKKWCWARAGYLADGGLFQVLKSDDGNGGDIEYLVAEEVWSQSDALRREMSPNSFRLALFYIPQSNKHLVVRVPVPRSEDDSYGHSATGVYEDAVKGMVKPVWSGGEYVISEATERAEALNPARWPEDKSDDDILNEALQGRYITDPGHKAVVKALTGE